jgi:hypothetical protein
LFLNSGREQLPDLSEFRIQIAGERRKKGSLRTAEFLVSFFRLLLLNIEVFHFRPKGNA